MLAARSRDPAGKSVLDIFLKGFVGGKLGSLGAFCAAFGMPLRGGSSIFDVPASGGGIAG
jgi:hypothetical protein